MFKFIENYFKKRKQIKNYSSTTTDATEGANSKKELNLEIKDLLKNIDNGNIINNEQLNKLIEFYFNKEPIKHKIFKFHKYMRDSMCFEIVTINTILDENKDVNNIIFIMKEITHNAELSLNISIKDFYDFLSPIEISTTSSKGD